MHDLVFLIDFDNTLIDHDRFKRDIGTWVDAHAPSLGSARFWEVYEDVRRETEIVDLPEVASRFAFEVGSQALHRELTAFLWDYPFREIAFPGSHDAVRYLATLGTTVILCDGHEPFQRHKLERAGFANAANHNILVCVHKENHAGEIRELYPSRHYVIIDDKPRIHAAMKAQFGGHITTILVRQGHYAAVPKPGEAATGIDLEVRSIREVAALFHDSDDGVLVNSPAAPLAAP